MLLVAVGSFMSCKAQVAPYQTNQNLTPPLYGSYAVPIPNAYLLHFTDWPFLTGTNGLPPNAGVQRVNGGANWNQLETARGTYSTTLGTLTFAWSGSCTSISGSGGSGNGWVPAADCNNTNQTITEGGSTKVAGNLLYTFNTVPGWASSGGSGWPISAVTVTGCSTGTCTVNLTINATGFTLNANSSQKDVVSINGMTSVDAGASLGTGATLSGVSGSGASTVVTYTLPQTYYSGTTLITRKDCPSVVTCTIPSGSTVTYGAAYPPSDIYNWNESCSGSDVYLGSSVKGDCYFREFVTHLMEQNCNVSSLPASPLYGKCAIHYFEGWNEFNTDGYWEGNYTKLAEMMLDADQIIKQFCGDCYFIGGSVSAGGDGYHQYYSTGADGSAVYSQALGQLLHDWYFQTQARGSQQDPYPTVLYPDAISFHPYPSHDDILNPPTPETNLSYNDMSDAGCYAASANTTHGVNEPVPYSGTGTEPPHLVCRDSVISATAEMENLIAELPPSYGFPSGIPLWNTESGIGPIFSSDEGIKTATSSAHDPWDASLTAFLDQAYLARQAILTAASGDAINLWYQADNTTWAPLFYLPAGQWLKNNGYSAGAFIWDGQSIQKCTTGGTSGSIFPSFSHSGGTTTDGSVMWTNVSSNWTANTNYGAGAIVWDGQHLQETNKGGISGSSTPSWNATQGGTTTDSGVTWETMIADPDIVSGTNSNPVSTPMGRTFNRIYAWFHGRNIQFTGIPSSSLKTYTHSTAYNTNDLVSQNGLLYRVAQGGTSGSSGPTWVQGMNNVVKDGSVTWELVGTSKCWDNSTFTGTLNPPYLQGTIQTQSVWTCPVSEMVNGSNYTGQLVWYTPRDTSYSYAVPSGTNCIWDIDGNELSRKYPANMTVFNRPALIDNYVDSVCTAP